jgi:LacI family transcriptional regulator
VDDRRAATEVTRSPLALGNGRIGFIKGPAAHAAAKLRYDGFAHAHHQTGIAVDTHMIRQGTFTFESGRECADEILARDPCPSAFFASNDNMAAGALHVAHERGLSIPMGLAGVGFDDSPPSRQVWPSVLRFAYEVILRSSSGSAPT